MTTRRLARWVFVNPAVIAGPSILQRLGTHSVFLIDDILRAVP